MSHRSGAIVDIYKLNIYAHMHKNVIAFATNDPLWFIVV